MLHTEQQKRPPGRRRLHFILPTIFRPLLLLFFSGPEKQLGFLSLGVVFVFPIPLLRFFSLPEVVLLSLSRQYLKKEVRELLLLLLSLMLIVLIVAKPHIESRALNKKKQ